MSLLKNESLDLDLSPDVKIGIVVSEYNTEITGSLFETCQKTLINHGVDPKNIDAVKAPGAFELPFSCQQLAQSGGYDAVIALGCIIRGETSHYDHIADAVAQGVMRVSLDFNMPVILGVLTVENLQQAKDRIKNGKRGDKGVEAALSALQMI